jgi:hypothetical protein
MPISGDHLRLCGLSLVIVTCPRSTTFSLVKKVKAVKMVITNPSIKTTIPAFFIASFLDGYYDLKLC